jgi:hypothetical protein
LFLVGSAQAGMPGNDGEFKSQTVIARLDRAIQYAVNFRSNSGVSGILGRPVKPGDDSGARDSD